MVQEEKQAAVNDLLSSQDPYKYHRDTKESEEKEENRRNS